MRSIFAFLLDASGWVFDLLGAYGEEIFLLVLLAFLGWVAINLKPIFKAAQRGEKHHEAPKPRTVIRQSGADKKRPSEPSVTRIGRGK